MERSPNQVNLKCAPETKQLLQWLAQRTGEKQYRVLHRLLAQEWSRLERARQQGSTWKPPSSSS